ncbi:MAG: AbrB/MazE/SpoVT family DNA-binding domain-containing protein [Patescibacteria group bacterium]
MKSKNCEEPVFPEVSGTAVLGERGQLVIPKETRDALEMNAGDKFVVMHTHQMIMLLPVETFKSHISKMTQFTNQISKL